MKAVILSITILLFTCSFSLGQKKTSAEQTLTMIDRYFNSYSGQPKFQVTTMGEAMVKRTNEIGMWTHPSIARIMKQVKLYKYLNFDSSPDASGEVVNQVDAKNKIDLLYREYFKWELNGKTLSVIYTKGPDDNITELVYLTIDNKQIHISCFAGDHIDLESVRALAQNK